jgi:hypothetical protein
VTAVFLQVREEKKCHVTCEHVKNDGFHFHFVFFDQVTSISSVRRRNRLLYARTFSLDARQSGHETSLRTTPQDRTASCEGLHRFTTSRHAIPLTKTYAQIIYVLSNKETWRTCRLQIKMQRKMSVTIPYPRYVQSEKIKNKNKILFLFL